jgi:hypothetical protein
LPAISPEADRCASDSINIEMIEIEMIEMAVLLHDYLNLLARTAAHLENRCEIHNLPTHNESPML